MSSLAMAEELPEDGRLVSIELDRFLVEFGEATRNSCAAGTKIRCIVGAAKDALAALKVESEDAGFRRFDFVVIDADRANMAHYFDTVWGSPLLADNGMVCIDITPYKGQAPVRFGVNTPGGSNSDNAQ